jgi:hypothetical protein
MRVRVRLSCACVVCVCCVRVRVHVHVRVRVMCLSCVSSSYSYSSSSSLLLLLNCGFACKRTTNVAAHPGQMLAHGMVPFRFGGLVRNTLWTVVTEACPSPRPTTTPAGQAAFRVVTDINSFQVRAIHCVCVCVCVCVFAFLLHRLPT